MLLTHKRFFSSIDIASHFPKVLPTNLLSEMLRKAGTEESSETTRFKGYEIERIFEEIDNREDIEKSWNSIEHMMIYPIWSMFESFELARIHH